MFGNQLNVVFLSNSSSTIAPRLPKLSKTKGALHEVIVRDKIYKIPLIIYDFIFIKKLFYYQLIHSFDRWHGHWWKMFKWARMDINTSKLMDMVLDSPRPCPYPCRPLSLLNISTTFRLIEVKILWVEKNMLKYLKNIY